MMDIIHYHFGEHPVIAFILMLCFSSGALLLDFVARAHDAVPFAQLAACMMTVVVGYKTLKKLNKDDRNERPGKQQ